MAGINYIELHTPDVDKARAFYGELFGWSFKPFSTGPRYDELETNTPMKGGVMEDKQTFWMQYIDVLDLDASTTKAKKLGGRVLKERTEVPGHGAFAVVSDPGGATFALWQKTA